MTAATTMGYRPATSSGGGHGIKNRYDGDFLECFFDGWESFFCGATASKEALAKETVREPDVFDYVFEGVESFACRDDSTTTTTTQRGGHYDNYGGYPREQSIERPVPYQYHGIPVSRSQMMKTQIYGKTTSGGGCCGMEYETEDDLTLRRENSLVEKGPNGAPALLLSPKDRAAARDGSFAGSLGREGDLLDYCFEHVESCVCSNNGDGGGSFEPSRSSLSKTSSCYTYESGLGGGKGRTPPRSSHPVPVRSTTNNQRDQQRERNPRDRSSSSSHPESSHPIPTEITTPRCFRTKKRRKRRKQKQNYYPDEEDNVLLYYRPVKQDE